MHVSFWVAVSIIQTCTWTERWVCFESQTEGVIRSPFQKVALEVEIDGPMDGQCILVNVPADQLVSEFCPVRCIVHACGDDMLCTDHGPP